MGDGGVGGGGDLGDVEFGGLGALVEGLDVVVDGGDFGGFRTVERDEAGGEGVEHEGVVGVGAVADRRMGWWPTVKRRSRKG